MIAATYLSPVILALASFNAVTGLVVRSPEVVPGEGLPSLQELGITSAELYAMGRPEPSALVKESTIEARFEPKCGPTNSAYVNVNDVIACYNYLKKLGNQKCVAPPNLGIVKFCRAGAAAVSGQAIRSGGSTSSCKHVADAVLWSVNNCTRGDKKVAGHQAATGNGNLIVGSTSNSYIGGQ